MTSRAFATILFLVSVACTGRAAAQESLRADYERCVADLTACCGSGKPDPEGGFASLLVWFRDQLPQVLQLGATDLEKNGVKLSDATLKATQKGADPQKQLAALQEITSAAQKLDARNAQAIDKTTHVKIDAVSTQATTKPIVNDNVVKKQQIMQK